MDFTIKKEIADLYDRIAAFVDEHLIPLEADPACYDAHENIASEPLATMREKARGEGLWCPPLTPENGGLGIGKVGMAVCYEAMNRSIFGPVVFNAAAPDNGNMMVLEALATDAQKERWLKPIVDGDVRSAFIMTEPHPGGGSDPGMMQTVATLDGDDHVINGHKWFITGAEEAAHFILVARISDDARLACHADRDRPPPGDESRLGNRSRRLCAKGGVNGQNSCCQPPP